MQSRKLWRFISDATPGELKGREIVVADEASARHLAEILCLDSVRWRLQSEEELVPETVTQMTKMISVSGDAPVAKAPIPQAPPQVQSPVSASLSAPGDAFVVSALEPSEAEAKPSQPTRLDLQPEVLAAAAVPPPPSFKAEPSRSGSERRGARRVEARLRIILMNQTRTFRAFSSDLSLGGAKLDRSIPTEILGTRCRVLIGDAEGRQNLAMECEILADRNSVRRLRFADVSSTAAEELERWLVKASKSGIPKVA